MAESMHVVRKWLPVILIAVTCALLLASPSRAEQPKVGEPAPDFDVTTFDEKELTLADFKGQVLLINFWATWCVPCRTELPLIDGFYRVTNKYGLRVLAVTTEDSAPLRDLKPLAEKVAIQMARHFHGPYKNSRIVPMNYVIDRAGVVRYAQAGAFDLGKLNAVVIPLLNEPAPH